MKATLFLLEEPPSLQPGADVPGKAEKSDPWMLVPDVASRAFSIYGAGLSSESPPPHSLMKGCCRMLKKD
ncbi:hypothetical protein CHARACLAT_030163 [Characodon lateralis]|uniref:Uncharacterized protein n=1 Tax=Characodon lateralis TaxID=208331 RepID=A0ABU7E804_9TELE|nr:hypothetical protein [Characodon lateralis]